MQAMIAFVDDHSEAYGVEPRLPEIRILVRAVTSVTAMRRRSCSNACMR
jgi:hypothetical protein